MAYTKQSDRELLQAALVGYQHQLDTINQRMAEIRQELGGRGERMAATAAVPGRRRGMSAETRERMAEAQRRRWAGVKGAGKPAGKKRKMSAEGKARIAEATRKRWEAYRAQKAAAK